MSQKFSSRLLIITIGIMFAMLSSRRAILNFGEKFDQTGWFQGVKRPKFWCRQFGFSRRPPETRRYGRFSGSREANYRVVHLVILVILTIANMFVRMCCSGLPRGGCYEASESPKHCQTLPGKLPPATLKISFKRMRNHCFVLILWKMLSWWESILGDGDKVDAVSGLRVCSKWRNFR